MPVSERRLQTESMSADGQACGETHPGRAAKPARSTGSNRARFGSTPGILLRHFLDGAPEDQPPQPLRALFTALIKQSTVTCPLPLQLNAGHWRAYRTCDLSLHFVDAENRRGFSQSIPLQNRESDAVPKIENLRIKWSST